MEADDPFDSIAKHCHISSSQESSLRRFRFGHESSQDQEVSGEISECSTAIRMMSLPKTPESKDPNDKNTPHDEDVFHTPPEESLIASSDDDRNDGKAFIGEQPMDICEKGEKTVDLGADTDLGFSVEQRLDSENQVIDKRMGDESGGNRKKIMRLTEITGLETKASDVGSGDVTAVASTGNPNLARNSRDDIEKYRYVGSSVPTQGKRALPASLGGGEVKKNAGKESDSGKNNTSKRQMFLDVMKILKKDADESYRGLEGKSILDVMKSRGVTFP